MRLRIEQAAVVSRHAVAAVAAVDQVEQVAEVVPDGRSIGRVVVLPSVGDSPEGTGDFVAMAPK